MLFSPVTYVQSVLSIGGKDLERVNEYKYLGILIDDELKFNNHINIIKTKISRLGGITFKIGKFLSIEAAGSFYFYFYWVTAQTSKKSVDAPEFSA